MLKSLFLSVGIIALGAQANAKTPNIVTDIAPIHSLVSMVVGDDFTVQVLIDGNASPHDFAMKPSQASALQTADIIFFVGHALTPWIARTLGNLAGNAQQIELLDIQNTKKLAFRDVQSFSHDHDHSHDHGDTNDVDPHAWMSTHNAAIWVNEIAMVLSEFHPENSAMYRQNADNAIKELSNLAAEIRNELAPFSDAPIVPFHDAFQYFESQFSLNAKGAFSLADGAKPSPKQIINIREIFVNNDVQCLLVEPQMNNSIIETAKAAHIKQAVLDPLDRTIPYGKDYYTQLMKKTARTIKECLKH